MIDAVLSRKNVGLKTKITVKSLVSLGVIVLAVALPQILHLALGQSGGVQWLPMYLPVLLGGCLLGWAWGLGVGVLSPIVSFLLTLAMGNPMPALARLPFMIVELAVFACVSGLFSKKITKNLWMAFPAVLLAAVSGRVVFMLLVLVFQSVSTLTPTLVWSQIQTGLLGLVLQAVVVPFVVMGLGKAMLKEKNDESRASEE